MSAQSDYLSWIIPSILAAIISFIIVALNRFSRTSDSTISGTVEIKGLQENFNNLKNEMGRQFDKMERNIEERTNNLDQQIEKVKDRISSIRGDIDLNTYRIQQLEDKNRNGNKNGGLKSAI